MSTSPERHRRVSLADVAQIAGVSSNTVSRVVRGDPEVAAATRQRISDILTEVGYRPHFAARALAAKRTDVIQVILAAPMFHGHGQTLLAVMTEAAKAELSVVISHADGGSHSLHHALPFDVDGVIILGGQEPTIEMALMTARFAPTVLLLSNQHKLAGISTVSMNNFSGGSCATEHLIAQGITRLVHLQGDLAWSDATERAEGFRSACAAAGLDPMVVNADSWDAAQGYEVMRAALSEEILPRLEDGERFGVFAANDQLALGAMRAARELGLAIPQQMAVVGFDNTDGAQCFAPPLTTIHQGFDKVGAHAVQQLQRLLAGEEPTDVVVEPELVIRSSSLY